jgi:hypothetical protein
VNEPMNPLDPRLLDALRADRAAPADARGRVRARLEAVVPEMRSAGGTGAGGGAGGAGAAAGAFGSRLTAAVALFLAGGAAGAALFSALSGTKPPRVVYVDRPVPVAGAMAPVMPAVAPMPGAIEGTPWSIARPEADPSKARRPAHPADAHASSLAAEQHLLDAARAAIVAGEPERAVTQLERHRAQFPDGLLVEERDAMMVEALAKSSRTSEARALAESFRARYPGSLFAATVDSAVAPIP